MIKWYIVSNMYLNTRWNIWISSDIGPRRYITNRFCKHYSKKEWRLTFPFLLKFWKKISSFSRLKITSVKTWPVFLTTNLPMVSRKKSCTSILARLNECCERKNTLIYALLQFCLLWPAYTFLSSGRVVCPWYYCQCWHSLIQVLSMSLRECTRTYMYLVLESSHEDNTGLPFNPSIRSRTWHPTDTSIALYSQRNI